MILRGTNCDDIDGEAEWDFSGGAVALSSDGTIVAAGAVGSDGDGIDSGHVRVVGWYDEAWNQLGDDIDGEAAADWSGSAVALSSDGTIVAVGAPGNDGDGSSSGHVRVFMWDDTTWNQLGDDIDGEAAGDSFGNAVALSSDGTIVAVGAVGSDGDGTDSGHVRVFGWYGEAWNQLGDDIDGEAAYDKFGSAVTLSSDGTIVAVDAPYNDGDNSGHVKVFNLEVSQCEVGALLSICIYLLTPFVSFQHLLPHLLPQRDLLQQADLLRFHPQHLLRFQPQHLALVVILTVSGLCIRNDSI
jgi:hypothetical protein